jgi:hypothetical protein
MKRVVKSFGIESAMTLSKEMILATMNELGQVGVK